MAPAVATAAHGSERHTTDFEEVRAEFDRQLAELDSSDDDDDENDAATYQVTFRNRTSGQYLTPPNFAAHSDDVRVFRRGKPASEGVKAVAENGGVPVLAAELTEKVDNANDGVSGVGGDGPIAPGEEVSFEFSTSQSRFSLVSMVICTNDGFGGVDSIRLPRRDGQTRQRLVRAYDAGTEINTELRDDLVPAPFCGDGVGTDQSNPELAENSVIKRHRTLRGVGDLPASFDWRGPVAELEITRVAPSLDYSVEFENLTSGQYLTPPNVAVHDRRADVFSVGKPASEGVKAVAENGGVPVLAAELQAAVDDAGLGSSTVGGSAPIAPGESSVFDLTGAGNRLSLVSMVICTNDGFAGLDARRIHLDSGESRTFYLRAYDAGTEINTELRADLVPAPFCGDGVGTDQSNPELAENSVIKRHRTLRGVGDLPASFDWRGPVAKLTITRK